MWMLGYNDNNDTENRVFVVNLHKAEKWFKFGLSEKDLQSKF